MKRQIRKNVFETNSSSSHTLTIGKRKPYMNWELETYRGQGLVYQKNNMFDVDLLHNTNCISSGNKLAIFISLMNILVDHKDVCESLYQIKNNESFSYFNIPIYSYVKEFLKEKYDIDLIWCRWDDTDELGFNWIDESAGETLYEIYKYVIGRDETDDLQTQYQYNYAKKKLIKIFKDETLFKNFLEAFIMNDDVIIVDEYEEW